MATLNFTSLSFRSIGGALNPAFRLVWPEERYWLETASGVLSAIGGGIAPGATASVQLIAQPGDVAPPADAVQIVGGNYVTGPGWADLRVGAYIFDTDQVRDGETFTSRTYVVKVSDVAADYPVCTNDAELAAALADVVTSINTLGAAFPGKVIELDPAHHFEQTTVTLPLNGRTKKVVLRSAAADRRAGARVKIKRLSIAGSSQLFVQGILAASPEIDPGGLITGGALGNLSDFVTLWRCGAKGGPLAWDSEGNRFVDFESDIDATSDWHPWFTTFWGNMSSGGFSRIDLWVGSHKSAQNGGALGVWTVATTPAYVGRNTPTGAAGMFTLQPTVNNGTGFSADFQVQALTASTTPPKPAGGPDGNYITGWRLNNGGTGYTMTNLAPRGSIVWPNQFTSNGANSGGANQPAGFGTGVVATSGGRIDNLNLIDCDVSDLNEGVRVGVRTANDSPWTFGGTIRSITNDFHQRFTSSPFLANGLQWCRMWFNQHYGVLSHANDWGNPHADEQPPPGGPGL